MLTQEYAAGFKDNLHAALKAVPDDWDVLFLNACFLKTSETAVRENIYVNHKSACTLAYVCRRKFALQVRLQLWVTLYVVSFQLGKVAAAYAPL